MELTYKSIDLTDPNKELIAFLKVHMTHVFNDQTFKWEYFFKPESTVFVTLLLEGKIIGTQSFLPIPLVLNERKVITGKSENSFIQDSYRRELNFYNLYYCGINECQGKNIRLFWGLTHLDKLWRKILHFDAYDKIMYSHILRISYPKFKDVNLSNFILSLLDYFRNIVSVVKLSFKTSILKAKINYRNLLKDFQILKEIDTDQSLDIFYGRLKQNNPNLVHLDVTREFLFWRVYSNPNLNYYSFFFMRNNKLEGYYIFSVKDQMAQLVDFIALEDVTYKLMMMHLIAQLKHLRIVNVEYFGNILNRINDKVFQLFKKVVGGKIILNKGLAFVVKNTSETHEIPDIKNWYINGLWTEGYKR